MQFFLNGITTNPWAKLRSSALFSTTFGINYAGKDCKHNEVNLNLLALTARSLIQHGLSPLPRRHMPRDVNLNKRKAPGEPAPLFDSAARSFLSLRFTDVTPSDGSSARAPRLKVQSFITPGPQQTFGDLNVNIYVMPDMFDPGDDAGERTEIEIDTTHFLGRPRGNSLTPEGESISALPGIKITKKGPIKHYGNSVCEHAIFAFETYAN